MALFNFTTAKIKRFEYKPLYFDERKERLEKMKAAADTAGKSHTVLGKGFLTARRPPPKTWTERGFSFLRIFTIVLLLVLLLVLAQEIYVLFLLLKGAK